MDSLEAVMRLEEHTQLLCLQSADFAEARTAFLEKRPPRFAA
jgi:enoyl-CoA hydratase/carnithine racemase